jgi:hypothetical protein
MDLTDTSICGGMICIVSFGPIIQVKGGHFLGRHASSHPVKWKKYREDEQLMVSQKGFIITFLTHKHGIQLETKWPILHTEAVFTTVAAELFERLSSAILLVVIMAAIYFDLQTGFAVFWGYG